MNLEMNPYIIVNALPSLDSSEIDNKSDCIVCFESKSLKTDFSHKCNQCKAIATCDNCISKLTKCPLCREHIVININIIKEELRNYNKVHGFCFKSYGLKMPTSIENEFFDRLLELCIEPHQIRSLAVYLDVESKFDFSRIEPIYDEYPDLTDFFDVFNTVMIYKDGRYCNQVIAEMIEEKYNNISSDTSTDRDFIKLACLCKTEEHVLDIISLFISIDVYSNPCFYIKMYYLSIRPNLQSFGFTINHTISSVLNFVKNPNESIKQKYLNHLTRNTIFDIQRF